ncbi:hypothetical protein H7F15_18335 [Pontibacter sp. Tf4]|uniref:hypothetical protein n=1 Tax=Pontibacter sp. Tf4 TaxID=2761620 RepID=UPI001629022D|nr:hypothetical protein [Pontibacter sp. Tf4]MBB6613005.1 hypothetical protein [Pontibacter sp. Tf4]
MMTEQLPKLTFKRKSSKRIQEMCRQYWSFVKTQQQETSFTYTLEGLANQHRCDPTNVEHTIALGCKAEISCSLCHNPIPVANRRALIALRTAGEHAVNCDDCTDYLRINYKILFALEQQHTYTRPVINVNHPKYDFFSKLLAYFPRVYPNLAPSTFIHHTSPLYPTKDDTWFDYFLKTRVTFTICNAKNEPIAIIDWPSGEGENSRETMMNYKRRLMVKSGIKYYVFPNDEHIFLAEAQTLKMRCFLSVLPNSLEEILTATQKREVLSYQLP